MSYLDKLLAGDSKTQRGTTQSTARQTTAPKTSTSNISTSQNKPGDYLAYLLGETTPSSAKVYRGTHTDTLGSVLASRPQRSSEGLGAIRTEEKQPEIPAATVSDAAKNLGSAWSDAWKSVTEAAGSVVDAAKDATKNMHFEDQKPYSTKAWTATDENGDLTQEMLDRSKAAYYKKNRTPSYTTRQQATQQTTAQAATQQAQPDTAAQLKALDDQLYALQDQIDSHYIKLDDLTTEQQIKAWDAELGRLEGQYSDIEDQMLALQEAPATETPRTMSGEEAIPSVEEQKQRYRQQQANTRDEFNDYLRRRQGDLTIAYETARQQTQAALGTDGYSDALIHEREVLDQLHFVDRQLGEEHAYNADEINEWDREHGGTIVGGTLAGTAESYAGSTLDFLGGSATTLVEGMDAAMAEDPTIADSGYMAVYNALDSAAKWLTEKGDALSESGEAHLNEAKGTTATQLGSFAIDVASNALQVAADAVTHRAGLGMVTFFTRAAGAGMREARMNGANNSDSFVYGMASGAVEVITEKLFDGLAGAFGKGKADDVVEAFIRKAAKTNEGRTTLRILSGMFEEGLEEVLSDLANPLISVIYDKGASLGDYATSEFWATTLYDFLVGAAVSAGGQVISVASGQDAEQNHVLSEKDKADAEGAKNYLQKRLGKLGLSEEATAVLVDGVETGELHAVDYAKGVEDAAKLGAMGLDAEQAAEISTFAAELNETQRQHAVDLGRQAVQGTETQAEAKHYGSIEEYSTSFAQPEAVTEIFDETPDADIVDFTRDFEKAYQMGLSGVSDSYLGNAATLTETQRRAAYEMGQQAAITQAEQAPALGSKAKTRKTGTVRAYGVTMAELQETFNDTQRTSYKLLASVARVTGLNIVLYKSTVDANGEIHAPNGMFKHEEDTIYIDVNAGVNKAMDMNDLGHYVMHQAFAHELTHFGEKWNAKDYNALRSAVFAALERKGTNVDLLIQNAMNSQPGLDYDGASREVVAEAMSDMFSQSTIVEQLANENPSLARRVLAKLKEWRDKFKQVLQRTSGMKPTEAKLLQEQDKYLDEMVTLWENMLKGAVANYQNAVKNSKTQAKAEQTASKTTETASKEEAEEPRILSAAERGQTEIQGRTADALAEKANKVFDAYIEEYDAAYKNGTATPLADALVELEGKIDDGVITLNAAVNEMKKIYDWGGVDGIIEYIESLQAETTADSKGVQEHIDERTLGSVGNPHMNAFSYEHPEVRPYIRAAARDLAQDVDGCESIMLRRNHAAKTGKGRMSMPSYPAHIQELFDYGFSKNDIREGIDNLLKGGGKENNIKSKRVEVILDEMLTRGWRGADGHVHSPNEEYIQVKSKIEGATDRNSFEHYLEENELSLIDGLVTEEELRAEWEAIQRGEVQFSTRRDDKVTLQTPVVQTKSLLAIHNLTADKMRSTLKLGAWPSPSIAIVDAKQGHSAYGEFSALFSRETIDPEVDSRNKVYGGDAWTPTNAAARVEYEVNYKVKRRFETDVNDLAKKVAGGIFSRSSTLSAAGIDEVTEKSVQEIAEKISRYPEVKAAYLAAQGEDIEVQHKEKQYNRYFDNNVLKRFIDRVGAQRLAEARANLHVGGSIADAVAGVRDDIIAISKEAYEEEHRNFLNKREARVPGMKQQAIDRWADEKITVFYMEDWVKDAWEFYENGAQSSEEVDRLATENALDDRVSAKEAAAWVEEQLSDLLGEPGIYNGKDYYTSTGNRKSFAQTHWDYTAENIVRAMNMDSARGAGMYGASGSGILATATPEYKNVAEMHADESRLRQEEPGEYDAAKDALNDALVEITQDIQRTTKHHSDNSYEEGEIIGDIMMQAASKLAKGGKRTTATVQQIFRKEGYNISTSQARQILDMFEMAANMPTGYFEAKPQRVVGFSEAVVVAAPDNTSEALLNQMIDAGMNVVTYEAGNDADRLRALNEQGVQFSTRRVDKQDYAWVENPGLTGKQLDDYNAVAAYIADHIGEAYTILENGTKVYIGEELPHEYTHSKYTQFLLERAKSKLKAKNRAANVLGDMIEIATNRRWEKTKHPGTKDAKYGMYRYSSAFAFPIKDRAGTVTDVRAYDVELLIRNASDGKKYLYDVVTLNRNHSAEFSLLERETRKGSFAAATRQSGSVDNVPQNQKNGKTQNSVRREVDGYPVYNRRALLKDETIEKYLKDYASSNPDYAQAYITYMSPRQFLNLTTGDAISRINIQQQSTALDPEKMGKVNAEQPIFLQIDADTGEVSGHEGRHRMVALDRAGIKEVPVLLFDSNNKYSKAPMDELMLSGQFNAYQTETVNDVLPLSRGYADQVHDKFAVKTSRETLAEKYQGKETLQYQQRRERLTDAQVLQRALKNERNNMTVEQKNATDIYQTKLDRLQELVEQRRESGKLWYQYQFGKETYDASKARAERNRMSILDQQVQRAENELLEAQDTQFLKQVLKSARTAIEAEERTAAAEQYREMQDFELQKRDELRKKLTAEGREKLKDYRNKRNESESAHKYRHRIQKQVAEFRDWLMHPSSKSDNKRVPKELEQPLLGFLEAIDMSSKRSLRGGEATKADLQLQAQMQALKNAIRPGLNEGGLDLPQEFQESFDGMIQVLTELMNTGDETFVINKMNSEQLKELSRQLKILKKAITTINALHNNGRFAHVGEAGDADFRYLGSFRRKTTSSKAGRFINFDYMRPSRILSRLGEGARSILMELRAGQAMEARLTNQILAFKEKTFTDAEALAWGKELHSFKLESGETITMTATQLMSLYCLSKREQAQTHIYGNGISVGTFKDGKITHTDDGHIVSLNDVQTMIGKLSERQLEVAKALQGFMNTEAAAWGNYVSTARFDVDMFTEENYFPISVDENALPAQGTEDAKGNDLYALLNMGFTKELKKNATERVKLYNIFDVFGNHVADMAQYRSFALPVLDAVKWFNYRDASGLTLRDQMDKAFGVDEKTGMGYAQSAIRNILKAYNSKETQGQKYDSFGLSMLSKFNASRVAWNARVVIQQPTAIARAAMVIKGKYLAAAAAQQGNLKADIEEMQANSGIAAWKDLGFFDTNISRNLVDLIRPSDDGAIEKARQKFTDVGLLGAEWGDKITWATMWRAAKMQVQAEAKAAGQTLTQEELLARTTELFEDCIYDTQVVDSVLTKSEFLRSKGLVARTFGAFMSEASATVSMVQDVFLGYSDDIARGMSKQEAWVKHKGKIGKVLTVYTVAEVLNTIAQSLIDGLFRDDDDYESKWEQLWEAFKGNLIENLLPFGKIPGVSDAFDAFKWMLDEAGYLNKINKALGTDFYGSLESGELIKATKYIKKFTQTMLDLIENGEKSKYTSWRGLYSGLQLLGVTSGFAVDNVYRTVQNFWNETVAELNPKLKIRQMNYDEEKRIKYAFLNGNLNEEEAIAELVNTGMDEDKAYWTVQDWDGESKYDDVKTAALNGSTAEFNAALETLTEHGVTAKQAAKEVKDIVRDIYIGAELSEKDAAIAGDRTLSRNEAKNILMRYAGLNSTAAQEYIEDMDFYLKNGYWYDDRKSAYLNGEISKTQAKNALMSVGNMSAYEAGLQITAWEWEQAMPDIGSVSASQVELYEEKCEAAGVSRENFMKVAKFKGQVRADKDANGNSINGTAKAKVLAYIDELNIPESQKEALRKSFYKK